MAQGDTTLKPEDILAALGAEGGFVCDRPTLGREQLDTLVRLVSPPVAPESRRDFEAGLQLIFASTASNVAIERRYNGSPAVILREKADAFVALLERTEQAVGALDPGLRRLIDLQLADHARRQGVERITRKSSMTLWTREISELIGIVAGLGRRLEIVPIQGQRNTAYRQMVRGLAALVHATTGEIPRRSTERKSVDQSSQEHYWFLDFCQIFARFVFERAPVATAAATNAPEGRSAEGKRKKLRATTERRADGNATPTRKIAGPPKLTMVVREELDRLTQEIDLRRKSTSGGEKGRVRRK